MIVKVVSMLLAVLVLFTGITAGGVRAQAADVTSPAFDHCLRPTTTVATCRPSVRVAAGFDDFGPGGDNANGAYDAYGSADVQDGSGQDLSSPEWWLDIAKQLANIFLAEVARTAVDWAFRAGGVEVPGDPDAVNQSPLFDPAR